VWDDDLGRYRRSGPVVLDGEGLEQRGGVLAGDVLEVEAVAVDHPPAPEREDLHCRPLPVGRDPEHVDVPHASLLDRLAFRQSAHGEETISVSRRLLETFALGRVAHLLLELAFDRARIAGEEVDDAFDDLPVVLLRDVADAGGMAAVDVVVEARDPGVAAGLWALARPVLEDAVEHVERLPHLLRVRVRAEVGDPAAVPLAREHDPRKVVLDRHCDVRERLVVAQADVEGRSVALDEVLLEVQRLDVAAGDDHLDVFDALRQLRDRVPATGRRLEVAAHARAERLRLADVEDGALRVTEDVDARLRRQQLQLVFEPLVHRDQA
jgi:hypothetical protein